MGYIYSSHDGFHKVSNPLFIKFVLPEVESDEIM